MPSTCNFSCAGCVFSASARLYRHHFAPRMIPRFRRRTERRTALAPEADGAQWTSPCAPTTPPVLTFRVAVGTGPGLLRLPLAASYGTSILEPLHRGCDHSVLENGYVPFLLAPGSPRGRLPLRGIVDTSSASSAMVSRFSSSTRSTTRAATRTASGRAQPTSRTW